MDNNVYLMVVTGYDSRWSVVGAMIHCQRRFARCSRCPVGESQNRKPNQKPQMALESDPVLVIGCWFWVVAVVPAVIVVVIVVLVEWWLRCRQGWLSSLIIVNELQISILTFNMAISDVSKISCARGRGLLWLPCQMVRGPKTVYRPNHLILRIIRQEVALLYQILPGSNHPVSCFEI